MELHFNQYIFMNFSPQVVTSYLAVCLCLTGGGGETPPTASRAGGLAGGAGLEEPRVGGAVEVGAVADVVEVHLVSGPAKHWEAQEGGGSVYIRAKLSAPPSPLSSHYD